MFSKSLLPFQLFLALLGAAILAPSAWSTSCEKSYQDESSQIYQCQELKVVVLKGEAISRAQKYGELIKSGQIKDLTLDYFANRIYTPLEKSAGWIQSIFKFLYGHWASYFHNKAPVQWRAETSALAKAAGLEQSYIDRAIILPDMVSYLHSLTSFSLIKKLAPMGCTSVAQKKNGFAYGRNLDFAGVGIWDQYPSLTVHVPAPGSNELRHISIGADGVHFAGITGVNEAGISFAVHQNFSNYRSTGIPLYYLGEMMLREARTLEAGIAFLKKHRPGPFWTFVLTDLNKAKVATVESSQDHFFVRVMEKNKFAQSNHFMHKASQEFEYAGHDFFLNSQRRVDFALESLDQLIEGESGASHLAQILSHQANETGELSGLHDVQKPSTIQTVIFDNPEGEKPINFYISHERAPTASGGYLQFQLSQLWQLAENPELNYQSVDLSLTEAEIRSRQTESSLAFRSYFDFNSREAARSYLKEHHSISAQIFEAASFFEDGNYEEAIIRAKHYDDSRYLTESPELLENLKELHLLALLALGRKTEAKRLAVEFIDAKIFTVALQKITKQIVSGKKPKLKVHFNFVTGSLRKLPESPYGDK